MSECYMCHKAVHNVIGGDVLCGDCDTHEVDDLRQVIKEHVEQARLDGLRWKAENERLRQELERKERDRLSAWENNRIIEEDRQRLRQERDEQDKACDLADESWKREVQEVVAQRDRALLALKQSVVASEMFTYPRKVKYCVGRDELDTQWPNWRTEERP